MGGTAVGVGTGTAEGKIASASLGESAGTGDHAVILVTKRHIEYHGAVVDQGGTGSCRQSCGAEFQRASVNGDATVVEAGQVAGQGQLVCTSLEQAAATAAG